MLSVVKTMDKASQHKQGTLARSQNSLVRQQTKNNDHMGNMSRMVLMICRTALCNH